MKKYRLLFALFATMFLVSATAQQHNVQGNITDSSGSSLSNATITVKGTKISTLSNQNGEFTISVPNGEAVLEVSLIGYKNQSIPVGNKNTISIVMEQTTNELNSVVVVGYGTARKKDLTGSVASISSDNLRLGGTVANVAQAMQGKAAGVQVQQTNFAPGASLSVVIRGGNSINTTNAPLYVVDGFITDNGAMINPNDIADIQILKDASAAAIYGARGANGVVLITTKKGTAGKLNIEASVSHGIQKLTYKPALITGEQYTEVQNAIAMEDGNPPPFPSSFPVTNTSWWDLATQDAVVDNQGVSLSSSDKNSKVYTSFYHLKQTGVLKRTGYERYSGRIGAEKTLSDRVKLGGNFYGAISSSTLQSYTGDITAPLYSIMTAPTNIPVYNQDGSYYRYLGKNNALANLLEPTNDLTNRLVNANMYLDYDIVKNLTYHIDGGAEFSQSTAGQYTPRTLVAGQASNGIAAQQMYNTTRWLVQQYITYKYNKGDHSLTVVGGYSNQRDLYELLGANNKGFSTDNFLYYNLGAGSLPSNPSSTKTEPLKAASFFGRLNYGFQDKILATFTFREDGSSKFPSAHRWGAFPSGALAYRLSNEKFIQDLNVFSSLKVRVGYGLTGNDRVNPYQYLTTFSNYSTVLDGSGNLQVGIEPSVLSNNSLKWESTSQLDIGFDMGFVNDRITATIDLYRKKTTDLLLNVPIGQWWGFNTQLINAGSIENKGIELAINTNNITAKDFSWESTFNIAYNKQKCLKLAPGVPVIISNTANPSGVVSAQGFTKLEPGQELGELYGYKYIGVIKTGEKYDPQPNAKPGDPKYADINNDGIITPDDRAYLGNTNPHYTAGFTNHFHYKGFDLTIFLQSSFGYYLYNMNRLVLESTTGTDVLNRFVAGKNENTDVPREGYFLSTYGSYVNSRFVENASYLRLKQVSLAYNIPQSLLSKLKIVEGLQLYINAQNLFTITGYSGTDPEVNVHTSNLGGGLDFGVFPAFRTFEFGAKLSIH
ncbi:MAG: SusC/RagA family TonB-linked outer membrane protein [Ilyomonas sp.]